MITQAVEILMAKMERASGSTRAATDPLGSMVMWAWALQNSYATYFEVSRPSPLAREWCYCNNDSDSE